MTLATHDDRRGLASRKHRTASTILAGRGSINSYEIAMAFSHLVRSHFRDPTTKIGKEVTCLNRIIIEAAPDQFSDRLVNLVDLGAGNGQKAEIIIRTLMRDEARIVHYYPIDVNRYLSRYAILNILLARKGRLPEADVVALINETFEPRMLEQIAEKRFPLDELVALNVGARMSPVELDGVTVPNRGLNLDFIRDTVSALKAIRHLAWYSPGITVYCLLGRTIGNYSSETRARLVSDLYRQMAPGDLLLLDAGLQPQEPSLLGMIDERIEQLEKDYLVGERFMRFEADTEGSRFRVGYDRSTRRVRYWFERPDSSIQEMGFSYLFRIGELPNILVESGFKIIGGATSMASSAATPQVSTGSECVAVLAGKPLG